MSGFAAPEAHGGGIDGTAQERIIGSLIIHGHHREIFI
jgi:hypothetical protein